MFFSDTAPLGKDKMRRIIYVMITLLALQANKAKSYNRTFVFPLTIFSLTHNSGGWTVHFMKHKSCVVLYSKQMTICFSHMSLKMFIRLLKTEFTIFSVGCSVGNETSASFLGLITLCCKRSSGSRSYKWLCGFPKYYRGEVTACRCAEDLWSNKLLFWAF